MSGNRAAFSLVTCFWPKIAPAFSAFATSLWLAAQKTNPPGADLVSTRRAKTMEGFCSVTRLRVREPDLNNIAIAIHYYFSVPQKVIT
jgi:hypothetical protein